MTEREEHTGYNSRQNRLHLLPLCQPAIDVSPKEDLFVQISGKGNEKNIREKFKGHYTTSVLYGTPKPVDENQRQGSDDSPGNPNQNSEGSVPVKPFHLYRKLWRDHLHEKHKTYTAEAQNQKRKRFINETDPQEVFVSNTPESQGGHSVSGEDEYCNEEKQMNQGMSLTQKQEKNRREN